MKPLRFQISLIVALLGFSSVPFYWLFCPPEEALRTKIFIGIVCVMALAAWGVSRVFTSCYESAFLAKQETTQDTSLDDCLKIRARTQEETECLRKNTKHLIGLTDKHQEHASQTTTAAAQATESATGIASAIEEMNSAIQEIGRQADDAAAIADGAVRKSVSANQSVVTLTEHTDKILSMLELIRSIAQKTNLLALNASIEAARAGEHGRGFSVVAQEVKALANQTANATKQIEAQVGSVRDSSKDARTHMTEVQGVIEQISAITTTIKGALQQEEAATKEIAASATMTTSAANIVTQGISYLLITTEEIRTSCVEINEHIESIDVVVREKMMGRL